MSKTFVVAAFAAIALVLLAADAPDAGPPKSKQINVVFGGLKGGRSIESPGMHALEPCGPGICFSVDLPSDKEIATVKFSCDGPACAQLHPCPDGGRCIATHAYDFDPSDKHKPYQWFGWTDSPLTAALTFQIGYPAAPAKSSNKATTKSTKKATTKANHMNFTQ